jgi:hypothetical protein
MADFTAPPAPSTHVVDIARAGAARGELGTSGPIDHVAVVPSTAEDPAGRRVLESLSTQPAVRT